MKSIFDLPVRSEDLSSTNQGLSNLHYAQIQSLRNIADSDGNKFGFGNGGIISLRWDMAAGEYWIPARSYIKIRMELSKGDGTQLDFSDDIAPASGIASTLFEKIQYKMANKTVSVISENLPQVDIYKKRLYQSGWMRDLGASTNFYQSSFDNRQRQVASNCKQVVDTDYYLSQSSATQVQLMPNLDVANDSIAWTQATKTIAITDAAANNLRTRISIGDHVQFTINNRTLICEILGVTNFIAGAGSGTFIVDKDFGSDVGATLFNVALPNITFYDRTPKGDLSSAALTVLFPGIEVGVDTMAYTLITNSIDLVDTNAANLLSIINQGTYIRFRIGGVIKTCKVLAKTGFAPGNGTFVIDRGFGSIDVVAANIAVGDIVALVPRQTESTNRSIKIFELIYQPPISVWDIQHAIPGQFSELELKPIPTNYKKFGIQSRIDDKNPETQNADNDYRLRITELYLYLAKCEGPLIDEKTYMLDLEEVTCQRHPITTASASNITFVVQPSTTALGISWQDQSSGADTRFPLTNFRTQDDIQNRLKRYYIRYAGQQKSQPDSDINAFNSGQQDIVEQYAKNLLYNGSFYDSSQETIQEWFERGLYLYHPWPKTQSDRSTRCYVLTEFDNSNNLFPNDPNGKNSILMCLFNHFKKVAIIKMSNGKISNVSVVNA